jgi:hypothetical protein
LAFLSEVLPRCRDSDDRQDHHPDHHVDRVQAGHAEVDVHEQLGALGDLGVRPSRCSL